MTEPSRQILTEKHSFFSEAKFRIKTTLLTGKRFAQNLLHPVRKFPRTDALGIKPVIAFSESDLWNVFDNRENWILTAGKIENLRIAARKLNGVEVKANQVFSFWKHIGNPNFGKKYVVGREIREGCIIPTTAGGLCQLSNALYDAALKADFDIVERHRHTRVVKGSLAEQDRDATVKWNYVDLRFKSSFNFKIEVELTSDKLIVVYRSEQKNQKSEEQDFKQRQSNKLNDCYSCGNFACFKHPDRTAIKQETSVTALILDEKWSEYDKYIQGIATEKDFFILPLRKSKFLTTNRYAWTVPSSKNVKITQKKGIYRALRLRFAPKHKNNVFELSLKLDKKIVQKAATLIPVECTHVVASQNLLPFLFEAGALGGRTYDVLMTRLPIEKLHDRLDKAFEKHGNSKTLKDFRAPAYLVNLENQALTKARNVITPHSEIAEIFKNKVIKLDWDIPIAETQIKTGNKILFPASAVGRKGAYEIRQLTRELNIEIFVSGQTIEEKDFWGDLNAKQFNGNFDEISLVAYPTYVEHQPRQLLKAISKGIPVVTTAASGLEKSELVTITETGDYESFREAVKRKLNELN